MWSHARRLPRPTRGRQTCADSAQREECTHVWFHITVSDAAAEFGIFAPDCADQVDAGNDALRDAGLPLSVKVSSKKTIGEGSSNPNLADGKGLEHFASSASAGHGG